MSGYIDEFKNHRVQLQEVLSLHRFERQSPRHEDEQSGITAIRNQARLGKDAGHKDSKPRRPERMA
jgi:hypothetical protein